ncbi:hypothetical protein BC835DRAFT_1305862, partial [Cytidiella melzeri]
MDTSKKNAPGPPGWFCRTMNPSMSCWKPKETWAVENVNMVMATASKNLFIVGVRQYMNEKVLTIKQRLKPYCGQRGLVEGLERVGCRTVTVSTATLLVTIEGEWGGGVNSVALLKVFIMLESRRGARGEREAQVYAPSVGLDALIVLTILVVLAVLIGVSMPFLPFSATPWAFFPVFRASSPAVVLVGACRVKFGVNFFLAMVIAASSGVRIKEGRQTVSTKHLESARFSHSDTDKDSLLPPPSHPRSTVLLEADADKASEILRTTGELLALDDEVQISDQPDTAGTEVESVNNCRALQLQLDQKFKHDTARILPVLHGITVMLEDPHFSLNMDGSYDEFHNVIQQIALKMRNPRDT